jgi:TnpA family transposase
MAAVRLPVLPLNPVDRRGELASNDRESLETSILPLHLLQICMVYINTLLLQQILARATIQE